VSDLLDREAILDWDWSDEPELPERNAQTAA